MRVRGMRRADVQRVVDLRVHALGESGRLDPRRRPQPGARETAGTQVAAWTSQEERVALVVEEDDAPEGGALGYATGVVAVWPPVWRVLRVGEVTEVFVDPAARRRGCARALLGALLPALAARGADVLRACVPSKNEGSLACLRAAGFETLHHVLERPAGRR